MKIINTLILLTLVALAAFPLWLSYEANAQPGVGGNSYLWIKQDIQKIYEGLPVIGVSSKDVIIGYYDPPTNRYPIYKEGVRITFSANLTPEQLEELDLKMITKGLKREGGKDLKDLLKEMKDDIKDLKAKKVDKPE